MHLQVRFDRIDESGLCFVFSAKSGHDPLVNGVLCDDVVDNHGIGFLTLPPQSAVGLLIEFQAPCKSKPNQRGTSGL